MSRLWLVRHGPTHAKTFVGWTDRPADLSDTGKINRLANALPRNAPIISSDLSRAIKTADAITRSQSRLPHDPNLREVHFGDWEDLNWDDVSQKNPELTHAIFETPGDTAPPGGESWNALSKRVFNAVSRLDQSHKDVIVVAHMGVILTVLQRALRCSAAHVLSHEISPLSLTVIDCANMKSAPDWQVEKINYFPPL